MYNLRRSGKRGLKSQGTSKINLVSMYKSNEILKTDTVSITYSYPL